MPRPANPRLAAAILIAASLVAGCAAMAPAYWRNHEFQGFLDQLASAPQVRTWSEDALRQRILTSASAEGIALRPDDLRVTRTPTGWRIETYYLARVDLLVYEVQLHFRPSADSR